MSTFYYSPAPIPSTVVGPSYQSQIPAAPFDPIIQRMQELSRTGVIDFYDQTNPDTAWLGNFDETPVVYDGFQYRNSEAAFQAQKFSDPTAKMQFTNLSGDQAFSKARGWDQYKRQDWLSVNVSTMKAILNAKCDQNPMILSRLLSTGNAYLREHNPVIGRDAFWSDNGDGSGQNMLGQLWMQIREERRRQMAPLPQIQQQPAVFPQPSIAPPISYPAQVAQRAQQTADRCFCIGCTRPANSPFLFCGRTHGREFMQAYYSIKDNHSICAYPGCGRPRYYPYDYCGKKHGTAMLEWKIKNNIS